ncbi:MAG: RNA polymerase subunit sigma-70, partial [Planctomycetes bacterium]|nr:RNA polymerase subunit sigma-70 [Planctomycetota bacterium]
MDTDEDLQELASADEEVQAVGDLYRRHHPAVLRVTQALLRQGADAQDAAQEAFLK